MPKFPVGPTSSRPGPILLKVAATAVKFVIRLKSSKAIRNMEDAKISIYTMKKIFVERTTSCGMALPSIFIFFTAFGCRKNMKLLADCFAENQDPGYFNAAACTSGTCTDKHQQYQDCPRNFRPGIKICCCISGCCDNGPTWKAAC